MFSLIMAVTCSVSVNDCVVGTGSSVDTDSCASLITGCLVFIDCDDNTLRVGLDCVVSPGCCIDSSCCVDLAYSSNAPAALHHKSATCSRHVLQEAVPLLLDSACFGAPLSVLFHIMPLWGGPLHSDCYAENAGKHSMAFSYTSFTLRS